MPVTTGSAFTALATETQITMSKLRHALSLFILASSLLVSPAVWASENKQTEGSKEAPLLLRDHPLADSLWQTATGTRADMGLFAKELGEADHVLLGEKHDNPMHHQIQSDLLSLALGKGRKGTLVLEMVEPRHEAALRDAVKGQEQAPDSENADEKKARLSKLEEALEWEKRGWPDWDNYRPIFATALDAGMSLAYGNPNRDVLMSVGRGGQLDNALLDDLRWELDYSAEERNSLEEELFKSHCEMMPRQSMGPLVTLQRLKDAHMARSMRQSLEKADVSVLIAGNGHVRKDRGVAKFLDRDRKTIAVGIIEVIRGERDVSDYSSFDPALYDYVWFTPRLDEEDPCEKFRVQLEQMKKKMNKKKVK